jgi:hypothetical protein
MKNAILPVCVVLIAAGSAYGTQKTKVSGSEISSKPGYIYSTAASRCVAVKMCSDVPGDICTIDDQPTGQPLYDLNNPSNLSTCNVTLFKP